MKRDEFRAWIFQNYNVPDGNTTIAPEMLDGILDYAEQMKPTTARFFLKKMLPSIPYEVIERVSLTSLNSSIDTLDLNTRSYNMVARAFLHRDGYFDGDKYFNASRYTIKDIIDAYDKDGSLFLNENRYGAKSLERLEDVLLECGLLNEQQILNITTARQKRAGL